MSPLPRFLFASCILLLSLESSAQQDFDFIEMGTLPEKVEHSAGLAVAGNESLWTHNDVSEDATLYEIDIRGELLRTVRIKGAEKMDFEDMTQDEDGNLFIGDFGNADQDRQKMKVYKFATSKIKVDVENSTDTEKRFFVVPEVIEFVLPFEAMQSKCHFDSEAMIWNKGRLTLFTKDRCDEVNNKLHMYTLPDDAGLYTAEDAGYFNWEDPDNNIKITGADLSLDGKSLVLLSDNAVHLFFGYKKDRYFAGSYRYIPMEESPKGAVCHLDYCNLFITESATEETPGRVLKLNLCSVKMD